MVKRRSNIPAISVLVVSALSVSVKPVAAEDSEFRYVPNDVTVSAGTDPEGTDFMKPQMATFNDPGVNVGITKTWPNVSYWGITSGRTPALVKSVIQFSDTPISYRFQVNDGVCWVMGQTVTKPQTTRVCVDYKGNNVSRNELRAPNREERENGIASLSLSDMYAVFPTGSAPEEMTLKNIVTVRYGYCNTSGCHSYDRNYVSKVRYYRYSPRLVVSLRDAVVECDQRGEIASCGSTVLNISADGIGQGSARARVRAEVVEPQMSSKTVVTAVAQGGDVEDFLLENGSNTEIAVSGGREYGFVLTPSITNLKPGGGTGSMRLTITLI